MVREVRLNVRMDSVTFDRLRDQAAKEGRTISEIIRHLVSEYLIARETGCSIAIVKRIQSERLPRSD